MAELIELKKKIIEKYGEESLEAGYVQHVFAKRSSDYFKKVCVNLLEK